MKKSPKIAIVTADDWQGLYVDGKLVEEDHSLYLYNVLDQLGIKYECFEADDDWIHERGRLPDKLGEVKICE